MIAIRALLLAAVLSVSVVASAAEEKPVPAKPTVACVGVEHQQFDFWLGDWDVYGGPDGKQRVGGNRIERSAHGCWLTEHWRSASGYDGTSLNAWDAQYRVWRQFWVGGDGVVLRLEGGLQGAAMVMTGELPKTDGGVQRQRISWTPNADDSVVQRWETSDDEGVTWAVSFLGTYRRKQP